MRSHRILIPIFALVAILPLLVHGCSCGHDLSFHVQSWLEAANQFRQGTLYPHWAFTPAWQAGEPRFIFYPPLSWMLGGLLVLLFPTNWTPVLFTWLALTGAGFAMHRLAREFAPPHAALLAAAVYLANPYMLFNAFERGAYGELLAAVWIPLILLAVLRKRPSMAGLAVPLCMVWLTNAPSGVMASYAVVLLALLRLGMMFFAKGESESSPVRLAITYTNGILLGLALASFYIIPAAWERKLVQVDMAILPNLRYQDNFLFTRTDYEPHNVTTHTVSVLALAVLLVTVALVAAVLIHGAKASENELQHEKAGTFPRGVQIALAVLTAVIAFLLFPVSSLVWAYLPNMRFVQFPWRLLTILSAIMAFALLPLLQLVPRGRKLALPLSLVVVLGLSLWTSALYRQGCDPGDLPEFAAQAFAAGHGAPATDEYTPVNADNDVDRTDNPGYWLVSGNPNDASPGTLPNPNAVNPDYDAAVPWEQTKADQAPHHFTLTLSQPQILVLNLRDYPGWRVRRDGSEVTQHIHRADGLLAVPLPEGVSTVDIQWRPMIDQTVGMAVSGCAFLFLVFRSRRIKAA